MRPIKKMAIRALRPVIVATACGLIAVTGVNRIVEFARATPHVGDILTFAPSSVVPSDNGVRLLVHRQDQFGCVLDLNVLRHSGGSLIVETETETDGGAGNLGVHWAGNRTSADTANCGSDADLIVDRRDLTILALSAGGYGVGPRRMPWLTGDIRCVDQKSSGCDSPCGLAGVFHARTSRHGNRSERSGLTGFRSLTAAIDTFTPGAAEGKFPATPLLGELRIQRGSRSCD
jgi:hypothetical protein